MTFFMTPLEDAKRLVDIYYQKGFDEVEAKAGILWNYFFYSCC